MKRLIAATVLAVAALTVGAAHADTLVVRATDDNRWQPAHRFIDRGDTIRWRNPSIQDHNIRSYGANWDFRRNLPRGESVTKRFRARGTYKYRCTKPGHSELENGVCTGMCGRIHVE